MSTDHVDDGLIGIDDGIVFNQTTSNVNKVELKLNS